MGISTSWVFNLSFVLWLWLTVNSGWHTAARLRQALVPYVYYQLESLYGAASISPSPDDIDQAIVKGFLELDKDIVWGPVDQIIQSESRRLAAERLAPAIGGTCALLSFYDTKTNIFHVACTGDSRAVLGRKSSDGSWTPIPLSIDQTGDTPSEVARLKEEHPGEDGVTSKGRVLGVIMCSRAFGDAAFKWTQELSEKLSKRYFAHDPYPNAHTPPYLTAAPVVTQTRIEPDSGDFVVMASDALWEMLSNDEVVGLVGGWIQSQSRKGVKDSANMSLKLSLPVKASSDSSPDTSAHADRPEQWGLTTSEDRFTLEDDNAATHLARNALGGKHTDLQAGLLTLQSPNSRNFRYDGIGTEENDRRLTNMLQRRSLHHSHLFLSDAFQPALNRGYAILSRSLRP